MAVCLRSRLRRGGIPNFHYYRASDSFVIIHVYVPASAQAVVTGVVPSPPRFLPSIFIAHRVQQSQCSSTFPRVLLLTHALALSASKFVRKKKSPRIYTSMHSGGFEFTKLTCTRLKDNLLRHRGDRLIYLPPTNLTFLTLNNPSPSPRQKASKPEHASIPIVTSAKTNLPDHIRVGRPTAWLQNYM